MIMFSKHPKGMEPSPAQLKAIGVSKETFQNIANKCRLYQNNGNICILMIDTYQLLEEHRKAMLVNQYKPHPFIERLAACEKASYASELYFYSTDGMEFHQLDVRTSVCRGTGNGYFKFATSNDGMDDDTGVGHFSVDKQRLFLLSKQNDAWKEYMSEPNPAVESILLGFMRAGSFAKKNVLIDLIGGTSTLIPLAFRKKLTHLFKKQDDQQYVAVSVTEHSPDEVLIGKDGDWKKIPVKHTRIMRDDCGDMTIIFKEDADYQKLLIPGSHKRKAGIYDTHNKKHNLAALKLERGEKLGIHEEPSCQRHTPLELVDNTHAKKLRRT